MTPQNKTYQTQSGTLIRVKTHEVLVSHLAEKGLLRTYAHFIKLKYTFGSSRLNKSNKAKLSRISGVPERTVRMYMKRFEGLGWVRRDRDDLIFCNLKTVYKKQNLQHNRFRYSTTIQISSLDTASVIETRLAATLVTANLQRQAVVLRKRKDADYQSQFGNLRSKSTKLLAKIPKGDDRTKLSVAKFGSLIGKKKTAGFRLKRRMQCLGYIECKKVFKPVYKTVRKPDGSLWLFPVLEGMFRTRGMLMTYKREIDTVIPRTPHVETHCASSSLSKLRKCTFPFLHGVSRWKSVPNHKLEIS